MEKESNQLRRSYAIVELYKEDIEEINDVLVEHFNDISYSTEKFTYKNVEEFIEHNNKKELFKFRIKAFAPYVEIEFERHAARLTVISDSALGDGIFYRIDKIVSARQKRYLRLMAFSCLILFVGFSLVSWLNAAISFLWLFTFLVVFVIGFLLLLYFMWYDLRRHSVVKVYSRKDESSFISRKKDDLILMLISGLFGGLLGVAGTLLVEHLKNQ